jgi:membrane fusion protein
MSELFRSQALRAKRAKAAGDIVIVAPVSHASLAFVAAAIAAAVALFLMLGTYTSHTTLIGQLVPDGGVIEVHASQAGTVMSKRVEDGARVDAGDVLFVITSERMSAALGATHELIGKQLAARRQSVEAQLREAKLLEEAERATLASRAAAAEAESRRLERMLADQADRVELAEEVAARYEQMHAEGFVSREQLLARIEGLFDQRARRDSLERERAQLERQLLEARNELATLPLRSASTRAELERAIAATDLEATENEARREVVVVAPARGIASAVNGEVGQAVEAGKSLVSIVPEGARLRAELVAPSRAIGFVDVDDDVLLRYPAYPHQKFGHHAGRVALVSRAAIPPGASAVRVEGSEPLYRVIVLLGSQSVPVYGERRMLRAGMLVEADVRLETRRLYEWVLEPVYALRGRAGS